MNSMPPKTIANEFEIRSLLHLSNGDVCVGGEDGKICLYETMSFKLKQTFQNKHSSFVNCLIELNSNELASASDDKTIIIWSKSNSNSFEYKQTLKEHSSYVYQLIKIPNDNDLLFGSCSSDKTIILWSKQYQPKIKLEHNDYLWCLLYIEKTRELISGSSSSFIFIYNLNEKKPKQIINTKEECSVFSLCEIKERMFACGHQNGTILIYGSKLNNINYELIQKIKECNKRITDLIYIKTNKLLISSCYRENKIDLFKMKEEEDQFELNETLQHKSVRALIEMPNEILISGSWDEKSIKIWHPS